MSPEQFLEHQASDARRKLVAASRRTGRAIESAVDVRGIVRRHPVAAMGTGLVGGFVVGSSAFASGRKAAGRVARAAVGPLLQPTVAALGSALAALLVGDPEPQD